jgi:hypothetical protein
MNLSKKKTIVLGLIMGIIVIILASVMLNGYGPKKSQQYIPNRSESPIYSWKSGGLHVVGNIVPDSCVLTTKNCVCNLSESSTSCTFNFNITDLSNNVRIQANQKSLNMSAIIYTKSIGCTDNESDQIQNCSIIFKWDKTNPGSENTQIQLVGDKGAQSLINLQINAK